MVNPGAIRVTKSDSSSELVPKMLLWYSSLRLREGVRYQPACARASVGIARSSSAATTTLSLAIGPPLLRQRDPVDRGWVHHQRPVPAGDELPNHSRLPVASGRKARAGRPRTRPARFRPEDVCLRGLPPEPARPAPGPRAGHPRADQEQRAGLGDRRRGRVRDQHVVADGPVRRQVRGSASRNPVFLAKLSLPPVFPSLT